MSEGSIIDTPIRELPAEPTPAPAPTQRPRSFARALGTIVACSLLVTAAAAALAGIASLTSDLRWSLAFVVLRWLLVAALLATPLVHQVAVRFGARWRMPWALQTPATALLLTCESIAFDILSARLG